MYLKGKPKGFNCLDKLGKNGWFKNKIVLVTNGLKQVNFGRRNNCQS